MYAINIYVHNNVLYKVTHADHKRDMENNGKEGGGSRWKAYGQEFRSIHHMFDMLIMNSKLD